MRFRAKAAAVFVAAMTGSAAVAQAASGSAGFSSPPVTSPPVTSPPVSTPPLSSTGPQVRLNAPVPTDQLMDSGLAAFHRGDHVEARRLFRQLAQRGVPAAETLLGTMAANGQGGAQDDAVAAAWFLRAARRGYAPAQMALADSFSRGRGVKQDRARAMQLARAAADQGQPGAAQIVARHGSPQHVALVVARRP